MFHTCADTLCRDATGKMAAHTMQHKLIIPEFTKKQDLTFQNFPEVVARHFIAGLSI